MQMQMYSNTPTFQTTKSHTSRPIFSQQNSYTTPASQSIGETAPFTSIPGEIPYTPPAIVSQQGNTVFTRGRTSSPSNPAQLSVFYNERTSNTPPHITPQTQGLPVQMSVFYNDRNANTPPPVLGEMNKIRTQQSPSFHQSGNTVIYQQSNTFSPTKGMQIQRNIFPQIQQMPGTYLQTQILSTQSPSRGLIQITNTPPRVRVDPPSSISLDASKEIARLKMRNQLLEREKASERKEKESLVEMVEKLKAHIKSLEERLKEKFRSTNESSNPSESEVLQRIQEQEDMFLKREQLFEEERNQLLKVLNYKDDLIGDMQKEHQYVIEDLKQQLEEKEKALEAEITRAAELLEKLGKLKEDWIREKEEIESEFEDQKESLESHTKKILEENEKVVIFNNGLLREVETLRSLNQGLEDKHASHLEEIKQKLNSQLENAKASLRSTFEIEKTSLENQIADIQKSYDNLQEKFEDLLSENQRLRQETEETKTYADSRVAEVEDRILALLDKNQDMMALIEAKSLELENFKQEFKNIQKENLDYVTQFKKESEKAILAQQALERLENRTIMEQEEFRSDKLKLESQTQNLEHKVLDLLADNDKLNQALLERIKENELLKISATGNRVVNEKNEELEQQIESYQIKFRDLEQKFEKLLSENAKLNAVFEKTHKELETSKARVSILEKELESKMKFINDQNAVTRSTTFHSEKEREILVSSLESLERMNHELRLSMENLNGYKQRLEDDIREKNKDFEELEKDFEELKRDFEAANLKNAKLEEENRELLEKMDGVEGNLNTQGQEIKLNYESALQYLSAEIELHKKSLIIARNTIEDCHKSYIDLKEEQKKTLSQNEALEAKVRNLEAQLSENHEILKEKAMDIERIHQDFEILHNENQELKKKDLLTEEDNENLQNLHSELEQYKQLASENEFLKTKAKDIEDKYLRLQSEFESLAARSKEHTEGLKKASSQNMETQKQLNELLRENAQLSQINQENISRMEEFQVQNERLKAEITDLLKANEKLNKKTQDLVYEHQSCFDQQKLEKEKMYHEFEQKHRKFIQESEFKMKELENQLKTVQLQFRNEMEASMRERKNMQQSFEAELDQLSQYNGTLKATLYEHENQINSLKAENENLYNENQRLQSSFEEKMFEMERHNQNYRVALSDMENTCHLISREKQEGNLGMMREKDRRYNENYVRFNSSNLPLPIVPKINSGIVDFERSRIGRTVGSFDRKTMDILKDNDRLNEQILRRCREIVGE